MKNILLLGVLLLSLNFCEAQFQKGQKLLGGQIGAVASSQETAFSNSGYTQNTFLNLNLSLSKFKSPLVANGFGLVYGYNYNHADNNNPPLEQRSYQHAIGIFINKTRLVPLARKLDLALTGTGGINYIFGKRTYVMSGSTSDLKAINPYLSGSLGVWYQLGQRLLLTCDFSNLLSLQYTHATTELHSTNSSRSENNNNFNLNAGLSNAQFGGLMIGIRYVLK